MLPAQEQRAALLRIISCITVLMGDCVMVCAACLGPHWLCTTNRLYFTLTLALRRTLTLDLNTYAYSCTYNCIQTQAHNPGM